MSKALVYVHAVEAGLLEQMPNETYRFTYHTGYHGPSVSLTMPTSSQSYEFDRFPPFFEGLLPEGILLEALLRKYKIDRNDYFKQLITVGQDLVGAVTIKELLS